MPQALLPPLAIGIFHHLYVLYNYQKLGVWKQVNENIAKTTKEHEKACIEEHKKRQFKAISHACFTHIFKRSHVCQ